MAPDDKQNNDTSNSSRVVLGPDDVGRALRRMAHEVLEGNRGGDDLVVVGEGGATYRFNTVSGSLKIEKN